jgi:ABC-type uncharacterized transport system auxiliary subunit
MDGRQGRRQRVPHRRARRALAALAACAGVLAAAPATSSAEVETFKYRIPVTVDGYEVKQTQLLGPRPPRPDL